MIHFLSVGLMLGLAAGVSPGPLLALVIAESLQYGVTSGVKVAIAPIISDIPILLATMFIISRLNDFQNMLGLISLVGGLFILVHGCRSLCVKKVALAIPSGQPYSLLKGVVVNVMSPHPYLFWLSVGVPTMSSALAAGVMSLVAFILGFYLMLVGSKIMLAIMAGRSRTFLASNLYLYILRFLGLLLCIFAILLFRDGVKQLGLV